MDRHALASWEHLVRFHRLALSEMDASLRARFGHTLDDYDALHQIAQNGAPITMGALAARLLVANSSCNRIVGRLVDAGHVKRTAGPIDRREVLVDLTARGRRLRRRMAAVHTRDIERLYARHLSAEENERLDIVFGRLLDNATARDLKTGT